MKKRILLAALFSFALPAFAQASVISASLIPDGTYVVKVEKIADSQHLLVAMNNGMETELVAAGSMTFAKVKVNDTIKVSIVKGKVPVYAVQ